MDIGTVSSRNAKLKDDIEHAGFEGERMLVRMLSVFIVDPM